MDYEVQLVDKIIDNIHNIKAKLPSHVLLSMVLKKCSVSQTLSDTDLGIMIENNTDLVDTYSIVNITDGIKLRKNGVKKPLLLLYWHPPEKSVLYHKYKIQPAVLNLEWIKIASNKLAEANIKTPLNVHLWVDIGMGREGVSPNDAFIIARAINMSPHLHLNGIGTHFPEQISVDPNDPLKWKRANITHYNKYKVLFDRFLLELKGENLITDKVVIHAATSNAINSHLTNVYYNMVRIGNLIYFGNKPYHTFHTKILQIKDYSVGEKYGYQHTLIKKNMRVALIETIRVNNASFHYKHYNLKEIMPGLLDITSITDPIDIGSTIYIKILH